MERVAILLEFFAGLTPKNHAMTQGTAPVGPKKRAWPSAEVPDRFGEGRKFCIFSKKKFWSIFFHRWQHTDV